MRALVRLSTALVGLVLAGTGLAGPARADYVGPSEFRSTAAVTRLTLTDGAGYLTVQPHLFSGGYDGFEVVVPAGDGEWTGPADVAVPDLGVHCLEQPGPDLSYQCGVPPGGDAYDNPNLPVGGFQVTIPVRHTGSATGLVGQTWMDGFGNDWSVDRFSADTFPVYDAPHTRSTAEIRTASLTRESYETWHQNGDAVVPVHLAVTPGETVTALDIPLPRTTWRITGTDAAGSGLQCFVRTAGPSLHCRPASGRTAFPSGRYPLVVDLHFEDADETRDPAYAVSTATLTVDGVASEVDSFSWLYPPYYP